MININGITSEDMGKLPPEIICKILLNVVYLRSQMDIDNIYNYINKIIKEIKPYLQFVHYFTFKNKIFKINIYKSYYNIKLDLYLLNHKQLPEIVTSSTFRYRDIDFNNKLCKFIITKYKPKITIKTYTADIKLLVYKMLKPEN